MKCIDLFAGVGGLSLGAARAGFEVAAAVETDSFAIETHARNFRTSTHLKNDVTQIRGKELLKKLNTKFIDCLIGGPPCQGFSSMGKRDLADVRNQLYVHFFRLVNEIQPNFFVAENVPGIMHSNYSPLREEAFNIISGDYEILAPLKIKASDYGAPTIRTRYFFIGYHKRLGNGILSESDFLNGEGIETVNVGQALHGLPDKLESHWLTDEHEWKEILRDRKSFFYDRLWGHIPKGIGDSESIEKLQFNLVSGFLSTKHTQSVIDRYKELSYGMQDKISKATRLNPEGYCPTLRAGTASDKGSYQALRPVHPYENRVITIREAARLQGFPDWFRFHKTKWHGFRQIGNSVSPLIAEHMLLPISKLGKY
jgi:DNA (cytosine-5)-methyltransferase 1